MVPLPGQTPTSNGFASRPSAGSRSCAQPTRTRSSPTRSSPREGARLPELAGAQGPRRFADGRRPARSRRAKTGDVETLGRAPRRASRQAARLRIAPYEWTLLHAAAQAQDTSQAVDLLLERGLDANTREKGDNTYAMHWAAAAGRVDVVRRLADAGGDVIGHGDDHELEVIGWATCWDGCDDAAHRAVVDFLVSRGARHHIFSAIAMDLARRGATDRRGRSIGAQPAAEPQREPPDAAALRGVQRTPEMVALLLELGADPLAVDGSGLPVAAYAECTGRPTAA